MSQKVVSFWLTASKKVISYLLLLSSIKYHSSAAGRHLRPLAGSRRPRRARSGPRPCQTHRMIPFSPAVCPRSRRAFLFLYPSLPAPAPAALPAPKPPGQTKSTRSRPGADACPLFFLRAFRPFAVPPPGLVALSTCSRKNRRPAAPIPSARCRSPTARRSQYASSIFPDRPPSLPRPGGKPAERKAPA